MEETTSSTVNTLITGLKGTPGVLALVALNIAAMVASYMLLTGVAERTAKREETIVRLLEHCLSSQQRGDNNGSEHTKGG